MSQATQSVAPSNISVTKSQVSQVDLKLKANQVKSKLKGLFKNVDSEKQGLVKHQLFFELLNLHSVKLPQQAITLLKRNHSKNDQIYYKDAVN